MKRLVKLMFGKHLLITNTLISGGLMALGDGAVQSLEKYKKQRGSYDLHRTRRLTLVGLVLTGPLNHAWYSVLDIVLPGKKYNVILRKMLSDQIIAAPLFCFCFFMERMAIVGLCFGPMLHYWYKGLERVLPGRTLKDVFKKVGLEQSFAAPFYIILFFMGIGTLEGQLLGESYQEFKSKFWDVYKADWTLWPAAQTLNFLFVPTKLRVLYVSGVTLIWNAYLAFKKHE